MPKIDLHTHTWASPDGGLLPKHFDAAFTRGLLDCVAVTDHNTIAAAQELKARFGKRIIVGEEISTAEGDLIGLYLTQPIAQGLTAREAVKRIKAQGGLVYVPHPFEKFRKSGGSGMLEALAYEVDIIETYNGRVLLPGVNNMAAGWAARHAVPAVASSDAHGFAGWGRTYTVISDMPTRDTLCVLLAEAVLVTRRPGVRMVLYPKVHRIRNYLKRAK